MTDPDKLDGLVARLRGPWRQTQSRHIAEELEAADTITALRAERDFLLTCGVIELAVRNPDVMEYVKHWEARAEAAEAEAARLTAENLRLNDLCRDLSHGLVNSEAEVARLMADIERHVEIAADESTRAEAAEAEVAQLKEEKQALGRQLNVARYGQPDFSWAVHKQAMDDLQAEVARLREAQTKPIAVCPECDIAGCHHIRAAKGEA